MRAAAQPRKRRRLPTIAERGPARQRVRTTSPSALREEVLSLREKVGRELVRKHTSGIAVTLGDISEEYVQDLRTIVDRMKVYDRMRNDPQVRGQLRAVQMTLISGVRWSVKGGNEERRKRIEANLLRKKGSPSKWWCSTSWYNFLYEALGAMDYGFSPFALSWAPPVDGFVGYSDITWLHPRSWDEDGWDLDAQDNLLGVRRSYTDNTGAPHVREYLPAEELFIVTWDRRGPNWEGNAFTRPMYRPWKLGEYAEKIDIIDLQNRGVGIPMAKLSGMGGKKERDTLTQMLKDLRGGSKERAFIVVDKDSEVTFLTSTGSVREAAATLSYHREMKSKAGGTEYFEQGSTTTGSRAGASALATGFFINVDAVRILLEDQINHGPGRMPGIVQRLEDKNYSRAHIDATGGYCYIEGSRVSPTEQLDNIDLLGDMISKQAIPANVKTTNYILERLTGDTLTEEEWQEAMALQPGAPAGAAPLVPGRNGGRPREAGDDEYGRDDRDSNRLKMKSPAEKKTPTGGSRQMRRPASWHWLN